MAKVTAPLLSFAASGQIAKTQVYATWKGRPYVRRLVVPSNPKTVAQTLTRSVFANGNSIWKIAAPDAQSPWDRFATGQVLTGRNAMMGSFVRELRGELNLQKMVFSPGAKGGLVADAMVLTPLAGAIDVTLTEPALPSDWTITAAFASTIADQDPETMTDFVSVTATDVATPFVVQLIGLVALTEYHVGGWFQYAKPDGSVAYGPSLLENIVTG